MDSVKFRSILRNNGIKISYVKGRYILQGNNAQIFQEYINLHPEVLACKMSLAEYLHELEVSCVSFEMNSLGKVEFFGSDKNIERLKGLIEREENIKLKSEFLALSKSEYFAKPSPLVNFEYPTMKKCYIANLEARKQYRYMCEKQYGVPYHILFSFTPNQELLTKKLVERYEESQQEYILTWNELERERALNEFLQ